MLYAHWSHAPWDKERWPTFTAPEMSCPHCGEYYHCERSFDQVQRLRNLLGKGLSLNSVHRCRVHNRFVGGALNSMHLRVALDMRIGNHNPGQLFKLAQASGFTTFGFYGSFLHTDIRPGRRWITKQGKKTWKTYLTF